MEKLKLEIELLQAENWKLEADLVVANTEPEPEEPQPDPAMLA